MTKKNIKILLACKDAGAANSFCQITKCGFSAGLDIYNICTGQAIAIFKNNGLSPQKSAIHDLNLNEIRRILKRVKPSLILLGTSFDSWTERRLCREAIQLNILTIGFVDWWSNFAERFSTPQTRDLKFLTDIVAVVDQDAYDGCLMEGIPERKLRRIGNPYWDFLWDNEKRISSLRQGIRLKLHIAQEDVFVLIISSMIRNLNLNLGYDENDFWRAITPLPQTTYDGRTIRWLVKAHPKESQISLRRSLGDNKIDLPIVDKFSSEELIAAADVILGTCSSVLLEAALLKRKTVSLQPGLKNNRLRYLQIFDHLHIPKITKYSKAPQIIELIRANQVPPARLQKMPFRLGQRRAFNRLANLIHQELSHRRSRSLL